MRYKVKDLYEKHQKDLQLRLIAGARGLRKQIKKPVAHRPGLTLAGYYPTKVDPTILVLGDTEIKYLNEMSEDTLHLRIDKLLTSKTIAVIVSKKRALPEKIITCCEERSIALFFSSMKTMAMINQLLMFLNDDLAPTITLHATLVEVYGVGVLIQGDSSIGKSEAALGLLEKGHRLISDDIVKIKRTDRRSLMGSGPKLTRHLIEIRGLGILNVAHLYGAVCVRPDKNIDIVIKLEEWNNQEMYDRVGLSEKHCNILDVDIPFYVLPVKPGRDVILLIETISLQHRLKDMGYHSAKEFHAKLLDTIASKQKVKNKHANYKTSDLKK